VVKKKLQLLKLHQLLPPLLLLLLLQTLLHQHLPPHLLKKRNNLFLMHQATFGWLFFCAPSMGALRGQGAAQT
jgi:hypothetical protein